jgi:hypothetical protein
MVTIELTLANNFTLEKSSTCAFRKYDEIYFVVTELLKLKDRI